MCESLNPYMCACVWGAHNFIENPSSRGTGNIQYTIPLGMASSVATISANEGSGIAPPKIKASERRRRNREATRSRLDVYESKSVMDDDVAAADAISEKSRRNRTAPTPATSSSTFRMPYWRQSVPSNVKDIREDHCHLAYNWLIDKGWIVGGPFDSEVKAQDRRDEHYDPWDGTSLTLTLFSGSQKDQRGAWFPHSMWPDFLKYYAMDLQNISRVPLFYNQKIANQEVYRFTLDFDFKGPTKETPEMILRIMAISQRVVCKYLPNRDNEVVVCQTAPTRNDPIGLAQKAFKAQKLRSWKRMREMNGGHELTNETDCLCHITDTNKHGDYIEYKSGLHPFWDFFVTIDQALQIRESILYALEHELGPRPVGCNRWKDVVDANPIEKGNLRLVGSYKTPACSVCHTRPEIKLTCPGCYGVGKIIDNRNYMPYVVLRGNDSQMDDKRKNHLMNNALEMVIRCSLHAPVGQGSSFGKKKDFTIPAGEPKLVPREIREIRKSITYTNGSQGPLTIREFSEDRKSLAAFRTKLFISGGDDRWKFVEKAIQTNLNVAYKDVHIKTMFTTKQRRFYIVNLCGYGSRYCQNLKRDHNSNTVYFYITKGTSTQPAQIFQKCHCRCASGTCKTYTSVGSRLSKYLALMLFDSDQEARRQQAYVVSGTVDTELSALPQMLSNNIVAVGEGAGGGGTSATTTTTRKNGTPIPDTLRPKDRRNVALLDSYIDVAASIKFDLD